MKTLISRLQRITAHASNNIRARFDRLMTQPEAGIEQSTEKAIYIVAGVVLALAVIGIITAFVTGYLGKLPS